MDKPIPNPVRSALLPSAEDDSRVIVNIGPSHPATHGTIQIVAELSGERVIRIRRSDLQTFVAPPVQAPDGAASSASTP